MSGGTDRDMDVRVRVPRQTRSSSSGDVNRDEDGGREGDARGSGGGRDGDGGREGDARGSGGGREGLGAAALSSGARGAEALEPLISTVLDALAKGAKTRGGPIAPGHPEAVAAAVGEVFGEVFGAAGGATGTAVLDRLTELLAHGSADPADPACAAHLHCPPLAVAVAADLAVSALNPSQDSWDQAPAATALETLLLQELARLVGYDGQRAAGVLTSGGTESNLMGLMLARDRVLGAATGEQVELTGVTGRAARPRILTSAAAHFSVQRAAALLGLGEEAVLSVPVDRQLRMDTDALASMLDACVERGELPVAVVATAGTTDTGAVDPLRACAALAAEYGAWLHVDAAYGGGALLSDRLAPLLDGLELADSLSLDWHKLGWQPAAAGIFLVREAETYASLARRAVYLNPTDDEEAGYPSLLGLSLRTTRRADAFKIAVTLRTLGREGLGRLVDACHELALSGARTVRTHPRLELHAEPVLTVFLFRYLPVDADEERGAEGKHGVEGKHGAAGKHGADGERSDRINAALRRRLLREGRAVVGRTELPGEGPGRVRLKLTLLNPHTTAEEVERLLLAVVAAGRAEEEEEEEAAAEMSEGVVLA
ncbi:pyridoxal phosphate-dependent decarboxylase family protein [Streptomyces sp. NPDC088554]|uniref:pyridoxal phosphate-dependent decarboxylase family protein n=1 Tax=Streptomyces sp. NPDC088554 TaxID=3365865 RepID=UPI00381A33A2